MKKKQLAKSTVVFGQVVRLSDVTTFRHGGTPSKSRESYWNGTIPWASPKDFSGPTLCDTKDHISKEAVANSAASVVSFETILCVIRSGILARRFPVAITGASMAFNQDVKAILPDPEWLDSEYLLYYLRCAQNRILEDGVKEGATVHSVRSGFLESMELYLPQLDEQRRIVARLNEQMAEIERARAAVDAQRKAVTEFPNAFLRHHFNCVNTASSLECSLADLCDIIRPMVDPRLPEYADLPHIFGEAIESGTGRLLTVRSASEDRMISGKFLYKQGDVLYSKLRPYLRKATMPQFDGLCSADMYPLTIKSERVLPEYLLWLLLSEQFTDYAATESARARMPKLNREQLFNFRARIPALELQRTVIDSMQSAMNEIGGLHKLLADESKDLETLSAKAMTSAFS